VPRYSVKQPKPSDDDLQQLLASTEKLMVGANFEIVPNEEIDLEEDRNDILRLRFRIPHDEFKFYRFFRRGKQEKRIWSSVFFGLIPGRRRGSSGRSATR